MSKSYNNTIPLFVSEKKLRKLVMKIKTNSLEPGEPKSTKDSALFDIYRAFASPAETADMARRFEEGIGWGECKQELFEYLNDHLSGPRAEYEKLTSDPGHIESVLKQGAERAREISVPYMEKIRSAVGIGSLG